MNDRELSTLIWLRVRDIVKLLLARELFKIMCGCPVFYYLFRQGNLL
ncbi:MAG: hypothetical protein LBQ76_00165 [Candidatus Fibromonas sp.]|nr:hypothetical protein [Candidatus Fibromonas sp.]